MVSSKAWGKPTGPTGGPEVEDAPLPQMALPQNDEPDLGVRQTEWEKQGETFEDVAQQYGGQTHLDIRQQYRSNSA